MKRTEHIIVNSRPDDKNYPHFRPASFRKTNLIVKKGQYLVDDEGDVIVVTSPNKKNYGNEFLQNINQPFFRAKYIGNPDDFLGFANQVRPANRKEIESAKKYKQPIGASVKEGEQINLL